MFQSSFCYTTFHNTWWYRRITGEIGSGAFRDEMGHHAGYTTCRHRLGFDVIEDNLTLYIVHYN
jgi:hypothetical protein